MRPSRRLEQIPPYLFAELERKIADKRAAGIDVISLGIGDPDTPTYAPIVAAAQRAVADPSTHQYPTNRGRPGVPRGGGRRSTSAASGSTLDPDTEVMPAIGAKECIFNLNLAFLDPGDVALASDPGYPVYTGGPLLAGAEPVLMPLEPELGFAPDLDAIAADALRARAADVLQLPQQPDGRDRARRVVRARRRARPARTTSWSSTTTPTARRPTTATSRRRSWPRPAPRRSASRSSRSPRATT